ncbi:hypothetical protein, partial [Paramuribaculum intestinale]
FFAFILSCVARYTPSSSSKNHSNKSQKSLAANFCELLIYFAKVRKLFKPVNSEAALVTMVCQSMPSKADNEAIQVQVHARYNMTAGTP